MSNVIAATERKAKMRRGLVVLWVALGTVLVACSHGTPTSGPTDTTMAPAVAQGDDEPLTAALAPQNALPSDASDAPIHCGYVRWAVKTGADPLAGQINLTPKATTITALTAMKPPFKKSTGRYPPNYKRFAAEEQTYAISATITAYNIEQDNDLHLVLTSGKDHMIVEIPNPACVKGGPLLSGITDARKAFLDKTGYKPVPPPPGKYSPPFVQTSLRVTVTGVLFFDFVHGQYGVARNGVELHPLQSIAFG